MRRLAIGLIVLTVVIGIAVAAAVLLRKSLAETVIAYSLAERGYPTATVEVDTFDLDQVILRGITLGPETPLSVERAQVVYDLQKLTSGDTRHLLIHLGGVRAELDFTSAEGPLAPFAAPQRTPEATPEQPPAAGSTATPALAFENLPQIVLADASIGIVTQDGRATLHFEGDIQPASGPGKLPRVTAEGRIASDQLPVQGQFDAAIADEKVDLAMEVSSGHGLDAKITAAADDLFAARRLELEARGELPAGDRFVWQLLGLPAPDNGTVRLEARFSGDLEEFEVPGGVPAIIDRLAQGGWKGRAAVELDTLNLPEWADGLTASVAFGIAFEHGSIHLDPEDTWSFGASRLSEAALAKVNLAPMLRDYLTTPFQGAISFAAGQDLRVSFKESEDGIVLTGKPDASLQWAQIDSRLHWKSELELAFAPDGSVARFAAKDIDAAAHDFSHPLASLRELRIRGQLTSATPDDIGGELDLSLDVAEVAAQGFRLTGVAAEIPLALQLDPGTQRVTLREAGSIQVNGCRVPGSPRITCPLEASLSEATIDLGPGAPRYAIQAELSPIEIVLPRQADAPLAVSINPTRVEAEGPLSTEVLPERLRLWNFDIGLPNYGLYAEDLDITLTPGSGGEFARFSIPRFGHRGEPSFLAPLEIHGEVKRAGDRFDVEARGRGAEGRAQFQIAGILQAQGDRGQATFMLPALTFVPGELQPTDLVPALAALEKVNGTIGVEASGVWSPEGVDGEADIEISSIDFAANGIGIMGLRGVLHLSDLVPLSASPDQKFRIQKIDAGLPIENARAQFGLETPPGKTPVLKIVSASGEVLGGLLRVRDWTFDPLAERQQVTVSIDRLQLARLFETIDIEGLSGSGTISGAVPITLSSEGIAVAEGTLAAQDDGALSFRSKEADQVLSKSGEQVDLMLRALKDFRYDELSMTLDKPMQGDATLKISLLGHNPDVLEGYPFRLNIALSGDLEPILAAIAKGRRLSSELLQRSLRLR